MQNVINNEDMMDFKFEAAAIFRHDKPIPPPNYFYNLFMEDGKIPISIIKDKNNVLWQHLANNKNNPADYKLQYVILTIKYNKEFKA